MSAARAPEEALPELDDYDFELPEGAIAQQPAARREDARLMVLERETGAVLERGEDHRVSALPDWLTPHDLLVVNTTRVLPARLVGRKASGGRAEALLLGPASEPGCFRALVRCRGRLRVGLELELGALPAVVTALGERGEVTLRFARDADPYAAGRAPLPPYLLGSRDDDDAGRAEDLERYQTVYAREAGAVAAPTAGLHLSESLLEALEQRGVERAEVVLHVGAGTFRPLDRAALDAGRLHPERYRLPEATAAAIARTRRRGGRVVAVGTTTTRVLEACAREGGEVEAGGGETDLFLRPGGALPRVVDGLLTNFHLPRSSLLMLVATLIGRPALLAAYAEATRAGFRFYSFGDAMLILPGAARGRRG